MSPLLQEGDYLTVPEALRLLPVGKSLLYDLVGHGVLPHVRVGLPGSRRSRILIERRGLEDYLARLKAGKDRPPPPRMDPDAIIARVRKRGGSSPAGSGGG